jgi:hypothetical protein
VLLGLFLAYHPLRELCLAGIPVQGSARQNAMKNRCSAVLSRRDRGLLGNTEQMLSLRGRMREDNRFRSCVGAIRLCDSTRIGLRPKWSSESSIWDKIDP